MIFERLIQSRVFFGFVAASFLVAGVIRWWW
jgi:hypothetical protein